MTVARMRDPLILERKSLHLTSTTGGLSVFRRERAGSIASMKLRRDGKVPGIVFDQVWKAGKGTCRCHAAFRAAVGVPLTMYASPLTVWEREDPRVDAGQGHHEAGK